MLENAASRLVKNKSSAAPPSQMNPPQIPLQLTSQPYTVVSNVILVYTVAPVSKHALNLHYEVVYEHRLELRPWKRKLWIYSLWA